MRSTRPAAAAVAETRVLSSITIARRVSIIGPAVAVPRIVVAPVRVREEIADGTALADDDRPLAGLDDDERALFATLLAPGVAQAYAPDDEDEVVGFGSAWLPQRLPEHLARVIRDHDVRISGI